MTNRSPLRNLTLGLLCFFGFAFLTIGLWYGLVGGVIEPLLRDNGMAGENLLRLALGSLAIFLGLGLLALLEGLGILREIETNTRGEKQPHPCAACGGRGTIQVAPGHQVACGTCNGTGRV